MRKGQVARGRFYLNGNVTRSIQAAVRLNAPMTDDDTMAKRIAHFAAKSDPDIASEDAVQVTLI